MLRKWNKLWGVESRRDTRASLKYETEKKSFSHLRILKIRLYTKGYRNKP